MLRSLVPFLVLSLLTACATEDAADETTVPTLSTTSTSTTVDVSTTEARANTTTTQPPGSTTTTQALQLGGELVFNGDFSDGTGSPAGWELISENPSQSVNFMTESGDKHISFFSPLDEEISWPEARSTVPFEVEPHTDYRLSVEARTATEGRLFLALVFLDEDGDEILLRGPGSPGVSGSDWNTIEATIESPAAAGSAYIVIRLPLSPELGDSDAFSVDVNSVSIREVLG